jgi:peptide/nickel transport system substrate-binding protein
MKKIISLLLAMVMVFGMVACGAKNDAPTVENAPATEAATQQAPAEETPEETEPVAAYEVETLKMSGGTDWGTPNPYLHASRGPGSAKMGMVYASLLEDDEEGIVSWLAESWSIDGLEYTFTLYEGLTFQDGEPLTTEDVAFSMDYYKEFTPVANYLGTGDGYIVESYNIVDDRTISITVNKANADTLSTLGGFVIIPKHIWENVEDPYTYTGDGYLVGSGAYMCTQYEAATGSYEFTAYEGWAGYSKPAAERVLFVPVSDELLAFENGEIDIASMPADLADTYLNNPEIGVVNKANDMGYKMLINFEKCPDFLELELRQALYAALNRQSIVDNVFRGAGSVGSAGYVPEGSVFFNDNCVKYDYDPAAAKTAFEGKGFSITMLIADGDADVNIAEIVKNDLVAAGIEVEVVAYDSATRDAMVNSGDYEFAIVGNGGWGNNPPTYMRTIFSDISKNGGGNPHSMGPIGYSNAEITELAENQRFEVDFEARKQMFKDIQMLVSEEIPLIVLANKSSYSMYRSDYYDNWMKTYAYQQAEQNRLSFMTR